jgi:cold shock CspA family protein
MLMIGRIKTVRSIEGYGFIASEDGVDRFFHRSSCVGMTLSDTLIGLYVEFEPALRSKGPCAVSVMLLSNTPAVGIPVGTVSTATTEV